MFQNLRNVFFNLVKFFFISYVFSKFYQVFLKWRENVSKPPECFLLIWSKFFLISYVFPKLLNYIKISSNNFFQLRQIFFLILPNSNFVVFSQNLVRKFFKNSVKFFKNCVNFLKIL